MADKLKKATVDKIFSLSKTGLSGREIGRKLGLSGDVVSKYLAGKAKAPSVETKDRVHELLKKKGTKWTLELLADTLDVGPSKVRQAIEELKDDHINVNVRDSVAEVDKEIPKSDDTRIDVSKFKGKKYLFGVTGDNHLGSKYARLDVLNALFDMWADQGVTEVYQCGNMIDGDARFNKFDLLVHGMQAQADYFAENWPQRKGITTHFVTGDDHEGWYVQREGVNIGQFLEDTCRRAGRTDIKYLGHMEHDVVFKGSENSTRMRVIHAGGGTAYAISYKTQKIVESYQGGEKPNILLVGHYHKFDWSYPREVNAIQVGCTEDQTPFMRKLNIQAMIGGVTMGFTVDPYGFAHGLNVKWDAFYDRDFYKNKKWNYLF